MADNSTTTIKAIFGTRAATDLAIEHLVRQHGVARTDIFIHSASEKNTAGSSPSGGDLSPKGNHIDGHHSQQRIVFDNKNYR